MSIQKNKQIQPIPKEDIKLGRCCSYCGEYFKRTIPIGEKEEDVVYHHNREAICHDCFSDMPDYEQKTKRDVKSHHNDKF